MYCLGKTSLTLVPALPKGQAGAKFCAPGCSGDGACQHRARVSGGVAGKGEVAKAEEKDSRGQWGEGEDGACERQTGAGSPGCWRGRHKAG